MHPPVQPLPIMDTGDLLSVRNGQVDVTRLNVDADELGEVALDGFLAPDEDRSLIRDDQRPRVDTFWVQVALDVVSSRRPNPVADGPTAERANGYRNAL